MNVYMKLINVLSVSKFEKYMSIIITNVLQSIKHVSTFILFHFIFYHHQLLLLYFI